MPYQPTNPYPYNTGIDLREGLTLQFKVDNYDTIVKFKIEIFDVLKNEKIYTIIREIGEISENNNEKTIIEGDKQIIQILDETDKLLYFDYYEGESALPVVGGFSEDNVCKLELTNYLKTIEQITYERYYNRVEDFSDFEITEITEDGMSYYILDENDYIVNINPDYIDFFNTVTKLVVPYQIQEKIVRGIGENVFVELINLEELILPSTIYEIKNRAFLGCEQLNLINFSYGLTLLGDEVFKDCYNLNKIELVDSITTMGKGCFQNCSNLNQVLLSESLKEISSFCFNNNSILSEIKLRNIEIINESAFNGCENLSKIEYSQNLKEIGKNAFYGCKALEEINLPNGLEKIGETAFEGCEGVFEIILPNSLTEIQQGAFKGCSMVIEMTIPFVGKNTTSTESKERIFGWFFGESETQIEGTIMQKYSKEKKGYFYIPESIGKVVITNEKKISYGAFYNCSEIIELTLNEGIESIEDYGFYNCHSLVDIELPSTIKSIKNYAFGLDNVEEVDD